MNTTFWMHISREVTVGKPLWGMLLANENFERTDPLRCALAKKAQARIRALKRTETALVQAILDGDILSELPEGSKDVIGELERALGSRPKRRVVFQPRQRTVSGCSREVFRSERERSFGALAERSITVQARSGAPKFARTLSLAR